MPSLLMNAGGIKYHSEPETCLNILICFYTLNVLMIPLLVVKHQPSFGRYSRGWRIWAELLNWHRMEQSFVMKIQLMMKSNVTAPSPLQSWCPMHTFLKD